MANPNKYREDIQRLAREAKLKGAIPEFADKEPIAGELNPFVFVITGTAASSNAGNSGDGTGGTTTANGETTQDETNETDPDNPNTWNKGGSSSSETTTETGVQDLESVIDGEVASTTKDGTNNTLTSEATGALTGLTGMTDCATTDCVKLHLDGQFPPPDGWDDPDTPPDKEGWELGYYWTSSSATTHYHATRSEAVANAQALADAILPAAGAGSYTSVTADDPYWYQITVYTSGGSPYGTAAAAGSACGTGPPESDAICALTEAPTETEWPTDGCYDLALIDGAFQANQYDSEAPDNAGGSQVDVCFGTSRTATVYVTANGGTMVVETVSGVPKTAQVYASDGTLQEAGDATDTFMSQHLPK